MILNYPKLYKAQNARKKNSSTLLFVCGSRARMCNLPAISILYTRYAVLMWVVWCVCVTLLNTRWSVFIGADICCIWHNVWLCGCCWCWWCCCRFRCIYSVSLEKNSKSIEIEGESVCRLHVCSLILNSHLNHSDNNYVASNLFVYLYFYAIII